jgi:hypothetical protein
VRFEPVHKKIESSQDIQDLIEGTDLVAFCADRPAGIASWMNQAALETRMPFVMGGYHGAAAEVGPFVLPYQTGCLDCFSGGVEEGDDNIPELAYMDRERLYHPNIHFVTALAAHLICSEMFKYLTGLGEPATYNHFYSLYLDTLSLTSITFERSKDCHSCRLEKHSALLAES